MFSLFLYIFSFNFSIRLFFDESMKTSFWLLYIQCTNVKSDCVQKNDKEKSKTSCIIGNDTVNGIKVDRRLPNDEIENE